MQLLLDSVIPKDLRIKYIYFANYLSIALLPFLFGGAFLQIEILFSSLFIFNYFIISLSIREKDLIFPLHYRRISQAVFVFLVYITLTIVNYRSNFDVDLFIFDFNDKHLPYLPSTVDVRSTVISIINSAGFLTLILTQLKLLLLKVKVDSVHIQNLGSRLFTFTACLVALFGAYCKIKGVDLYAEFFDQNTNYNRRFGLFGYKSNAASYLYLIIVYNLVTFREYKKNRKSYVTNLFLVIIGLILCESRGIYLTFLIFSSLCLLKYCLILRPIIRFYCFLLGFFLLIFLYALAGENFTGNLFFTKEPYLTLQENFDVSSSGILIETNPKGLRRNFKFIFVDNLELSNRTNELIITYEKDKLAIDYINTKSKLLTNLISCNVDSFRNIVLDLKNKMLKVKLKDSDETVKMDLKTIPNYFKARYIHIKNSGECTIGAYINGNFQTFYDTSSLIDKFRLFFAKYSTDRDKIYNVGYKIFKDNYLLGTGLGTFSKVVLIYRTLDLKREYWLHCDLGQLVIEIGLIGLIILINSLRLFVVLIKQFKLNSIGMVGIYSFLVYSCIDFPFHNITCRCLFVLVLFASVQKLPALNEN